MLFCPCIYVCRVYAQNFAYFFLNELLIFLFLSCWSLFFLSWIPIVCQMFNWWVFYPSVVVVQLLSPVQQFVTPWTAACKASLSFTNSWSLFRLIFIESVMPSNHLILCHPFLLLPSIFSSIRLFSSELAFHIRLPKYWSFSFSISPLNEYSELMSFRIH